MRKGGRGVQLRWFRTCVIWFDWAERENLRTNAETVRQPDLNLLYPNSNLTFSNALRVGAFVVIGQTIPITASYKNSAAVAWELFRRPRTLNSAVGVPLKISRLSVPEPGNVKTSNAKPSKKGRHLRRPFAHCGLKVASV